MSDLSKDYTQDPNSGTATNIGPWKECPTCKGTGHNPKAVCANCMGMGLVLNNPYKGM